MKKIGVLTSGGDAPGMNAILFGIAKASSANNIKVIGFTEGFSGLVTNTKQTLNSSLLLPYVRQGGTLLASSRYPEFEKQETIETAKRNINKNKLDGLIVIGGHVSMQGALKLSKALKIPIIGLPASIDNDISHTDFAVGFDTSINNVVNFIDNISDTSKAHNKLFLVEVMGRQSGAIAVHGALACSALGVITLENGASVINFKTILENYNNIIDSHKVIIIAEGAAEHLLPLRPHCKSALACIAEELSELFPKLEYRTQTLGYLQRGGAPTCFDRILGQKLGVAAVEKILANHANCMLGISNNTAISTNLELITSITFSDDSLSLLQKYNFATQK